MSDAIDLAGHDLLALSRPTLRALIGAALHDAASVAPALQEAGYAGGDAVFAAFRDWLLAREHREPDTLTLPEFETFASEYFRAAGWGVVSIGTLQDAVATVDCAEWGESEPAAELEHPACHLTTGMFANFFGHLSDGPLAVLEVECRSMGAPRCRFLLGAGDVMTAVYEAMAQGAGYEEAVGGIESEKARV
ncbi:MAG TPA: V4R domain-containing protein [Gemmatimonadaceae bacterium]|nr:V4R domain-containing protein [Gemmatimonadaceae bacterium]